MAANLLHESGTGKSSSRKTQYPLRLALTDYERTRALIDGEVKPEGIDLKTDVVWIENFCKRPVYEEYDVAEMSFSWYVAAFCQGAPVIALPFFPLRMTVLGHVFVRDDSPYRIPSDLVGKRIGVPAFRLTINLWLRGLMRDHYGLDPKDVKWISSEPEGAGYVPPQEIDLVFDPSASAEERLRRGEVDAAMLPEVPDELRDNRGGIRRLFLDAQAEMHTFFRETQIYPITHVFVMSEALRRREPWIADSMMNAFAAAQLACDRRYRELDVRLPLVDAAILLEQQRAAYGQNPYEQGLTPNNRRVIERFVQYAFEQNYIPRRPSIEELFVKYA